MENEITIKQVTEFSSDLTEKIENLVKQLDNNYQQLTDEDLKNMIQSESTKLFIATASDGTVCGMATLIVYRIPYKRKGWIEDVVVDNAFRGRGIAKALLEKVIAQAKQDGVKSLNLTSNPNRNAGGLYEKFGFEKRDTNVFRLQL